MTKTIACPVCEYPKAGLKWSLQDRLFEMTDERFPLFECDACGLLFMEKGTVEDRLSEFYPPRYWWKNAGWLAGLESSYRRWVVTLDHLRFLKANIEDPSSVRLLDVGCGDGLFVSIARQAGFESYGLDSSEEAVKLGQSQQGGRIFLGDPSALSESGSTYDLITMFHVLEHVPEPFRFLRNVQKLLKKPGGLIVQVPNRASWQARIFKRRWYGLDCPRHVCNYTEYALLYILGRSGFRIRRVKRFSLRDNAAAIVSSSFPGLDPIRMRVLEKGVRTSASILRQILYFKLLLLAQPVAWCEALAGRGGTVMVYSTWD